MLRGVRLGGGPEASPRAEMSARGLLHVLVLQAPFSLLDDLARMVAEVHSSVLLASNVINLHTAYWFEAALQQ